MRRASCRLVEPLAPEDCVAQSMPDASPAKWHLAHTTWFFEQFLLQPGLDGYRVFDEKYSYLFNSYYEAVGPRHARPERGLLTRPRLDEVMRYRAYVDEHMERLLARPDLPPGVESLLLLGVNHEEQHQELLLTDVKHLLSRNPLEPAYREVACDEEKHRIASTIEGSPRAGLQWLDQPGGLRDIGMHGSDAEFHFDNESPRHRVWLQPHRLASRLVTNAGYREFIREGGYRDSRHWLSDGWSAVQQHGWDRPLYWSEDLDSEFTLSGRRPLHPDAPVCHVSFYEADAFARWADARLPTEEEWETAAVRVPVAGNFAESGALHPRPPVHDGPLDQLFGDTWEWTSSAYAPYPGFRPAGGAVGEYNGKFMCNQMVLRGGSCATPSGHVRATYRNFFYPHARWQFSGIRLAKDGCA